jgi:hypothetical protein
MIYLIQAEGVGHIKIGFTDGDPMVRLAMLQTGSPVVLRLLGTLPGDETAEKNLHRQFASARVHGEWFKPVAELLALVPGAEPLKCEGVEVVEQSVQIRVLTVGRKQFTKNLFRQLRISPFIDWEGLYVAVKHQGSVSPDPTEFCNGTFWGWVQGEFNSNLDKYDEWVIFETKGHLVRWLVRGDGKYRELLKSSEFIGSIEAFWTAFGKLWMAEAQKLFIGA